MTYFTVTHNDQPVTDQRFATFGDAAAFVHQVAGQVFHDRTSVNPYRFNQGYAVVRHTPANVYV